MNKTQKIFLLQKFSENMENNKQTRGNVKLARKVERAGGKEIQSYGYINYNATSSGSKHFGRQVSPMFIGPVTKDIWPLLGDLPYNCWFVGRY